MLPLLIEGTALIFAWASAWFLLAAALRRNDLADVAWGPGFIVLSLYLLLAGTPDARDVLLATLVAIWGARLALHISLRNRGRPEDFRYRNWREEWGKTALVRSWLQVFLLQGGILLIIATPLFASAAAQGPPLSLPSWIGLAVWVFGFGFEAIGDDQLRRFRSDPANRDRILTTGLWRYSRHPNYFGEVILWWGIFLIVLPVPGAWWTIVSPLLLTFLILRVSGIPMLEKKYAGNPEFDEYRRRTSALFPLPPRAGDDLSPE